MELTTTRQVEVVLGRTFTPDQTARIAALIEIASGLVADAMRYTTAPAEIPPTVRAVTTAAVIRAYVNPTGAARDSAGPFSTEYQAGGGAGVFLTDDELARLSRILDADGNSVRGLWTLGTTRGDCWDAPVEEYDPFLTGWPAL